jgi:hypothetical protein
LCISSKISLSLNKRAAQIKVLSGRCRRHNGGRRCHRVVADRERGARIETFDAHDGQGLTLTHIAGLRTGCITGRQLCSPSACTGDEYGIILNSR